MGMFTEGYIQTVQETVAIDENYSGLLGCFQIVSDAIHNEQVMFESLFTLDYTTALNEEMSESNPIKKLGTFILKMIELVKAKIKSIIASIKEKFNKKKSKDLKDKVEEVKSKYKKPPTTHGATRNKSSQNKDINDRHNKANEDINKNINDKPEKEKPSKEPEKKEKPGFKTRSSSDKYTDEDKMKDQDKIDISLHTLNDGFDLDNEKIQNLIKKYSGSWIVFLDNKSMMELVNKSSLEYYNFTRDLINNIDKYSEDDVFELNKKLIISNTKAQKFLGYNPAENPKLFIKNLQDPCYIIDNTYKEIENIEKTINNTYNNLKKEVEDVINSKDSTSESEKENINKLKLIRTIVSIDQKNSIEIIKNLTVRATDTYSRYLYSLNYLLHDGSIDEAVELEESVKYDVDMDFDLL